MTDAHAQIKSQYDAIRTDAGRGDCTALFQTVLAVGEEIGLNAALRLLEQCVTEKRVAWVESRLDVLPYTWSPVQDGFHIFFEQYLGLSIPRDGELIEAAPGRMVMRWWNPCPTLDACVKLGLDTRQVCRCAYHRPAEALLRRIDPRLRFERNYQAIRPYTRYCEETIRLEMD